MCYDEKFFWIQYSFVFSEKKDLFTCCYVAKQLFWIAYFTDILSFEKFPKNLHRNLKTYLFVFNVICIFWNRIQKNFYCLEFCFLIYELNAVVSIHSNVFYPAKSTFWYNIFWLDSIRPTSSHETQIILRDMV